MWGRALPQALPNINGRLLRVHRFTPSEILMGYNPKWIIPQGSGLDRATAEIMDVATPLSELKYWEDHRAELKKGAVLTLTNYQSRIEANATAAWMPPSQRDLVLVRDLQRDKDHERKLDVRWLGPKLLVGVSTSGVSGYVQDLYDDRIKRYHLDNLKVYCEQKRGSNESSIDWGAMRYVGFLGQRAVDLYSPAYFS